MEEFKSSVLLKQLPEFKESLISGSVITMIGDSLLLYYLNGSEIIFHRLVSQK